MNAGAGNGDGRAAFLDKGVRSIGPAASTQPLAKTPMIFGMLASAVLTAVALLVALGRIGHPIDGQTLTNYGWSGVIVGVALLGFFAFLIRTRPRTTA